MKSTSKQLIWVAVIALVTVLLAIIISLNEKSNASQQLETNEDGGDSLATEKGDSEEELSFNLQQIRENGLQLAKAEMGQIEQVQSYPAKIVTNTDQQAHVTTSYAGRVEHVAVTLGQKVNAGQTLATLFIPDLVDQQANLQIAQQDLTLAQQDYDREKALWNQGISARQDYQKAYNAYQQAQIRVQAMRSRLSALGASANSRGQYVITAPISGVISSKDIVIGEQVLAAKPLFTIDQLDKLWLEFILPNDFDLDIQQNQIVEFKSLQTNHVFTAQVKSLTTQADSQTGRLQVRAQILAPAKELRPNLMVNVLLKSTDTLQVIRVLKSAVQKVEGKDVVFIAKAEKDLLHFTPTTVELGSISNDNQWIEIKTGIEAGQLYASRGSFLLKSELEKGEAEHGH